MRNRKKKRQNPNFEGPDFADLAVRCSKLDSGELLNALDVTLSSLCKYIPEYRRTMENEYLGEIDLAAQAIYAMARELSVRVGERPQVRPARQAREY